MARVITRPVANVIEQLELDGDTIATVDRLASVMDEVETTLTTIEPRSIDEPY